MAVETMVVIIDMIDCHYRERLITIENDINRRNGQLFKKVNSTE